MTTQEKINQIRKIINENRSLKDRYLNLEAAGYSIEERHMGSGGVGQVKTLKTETRVQIESGHGRYNYANCVIL